MLGTRFDGEIINKIKKQQTIKGKEQKKTMVKKVLNKKLTTLNANDYRQIFCSVFD